MEEKDQILIERYLANELSIMEKARFEHRRHTDAEFDREVKAFEEARRALDTVSREGLRNRFKERDKILDKQEKGTLPQKRNNTLWMVMAAAALIITMLAWKFLFQAGAPTVPGEQIAKDSTELKKHEVPPAPKQDMADDKGQKRDEEKDDPKSKGKEEKQNPEKELYAAYFEPYKDDTMDPNVKRGEEASSLDKFRENYWSGKYGDAVKTFTSLPEDYQRNNNIRFFYANALSKVDRDKEAETILEGIIQRDVSSYISEAHWYLGLVYLKQGKKDMARKEFKYCVENENGYKKKEAQALLNALQ